MSLKNFHVVFISFAAILTFLFGAWCFQHSERAMGLISMICGGVLVAYEVWAAKKLYPDS